MKNDSEKSKEEILLELQALRLKLSDMEKLKIRYTQLVDTFFESERFFRSLMENAIDGVSIISFEGIIIFESQSIEKILGYKPDDLIGYNVYDFVHPDDYYILSEAFNKLFRFPLELQTIKVRLSHIDTSWRTLELICKNHIEDPRISGIVINYRDISSRLLSEEKIKSRESQFQLLTENTPVAVFIFRKEGIVYANSTAERLLGYSKNEIMMMPLLKLIHPDYIEYVRNNLNSRLKGKYVPDRYEFKVVKKDGTSRWVDYFGSLIVFEGIPSILGSAFDITEHKNLQNILLESREYIAVTLNSIVDSVISTNKDGRIVVLNQEAERTTGWNFTEAFGRPINDVLKIITNPEDESESNPFTLVLKHRQKIFLEKYVLISKNGNEINIEGSCAPILYNDNITGIVLAFRDITEKNIMEEEIRRSHKIESIGVLTSGIAHDFSNLLTIILGNIILAKMYTKEGDRITEKLKESERAALKAKDLTKKLLSFSTFGMPVKISGSISKTLTDSVKLALIGSGIKVEFNISDDLKVMKFDPGQMSQVFNNLTSNAVKVMKENGKITIGAHNIFMEKENIHSLQHGNYVMITIKDEGPGISDENLAKIFDPYFTTAERDVYKGRGLGLSICYSIIKNHGGYISAKSKINEGTEFFIYLPA